MSEDTEKTDPGVPAARSEVEILATALAESNANATSSSNNTTRVLGVLLSLSLCGNIALSGLAIKVGVFGNDINMGGDHVAAEAPEFFPEELGYIEGEFDEFDEAMMEDLAAEPEHPPEDWCAEMKYAEEGEVHPADIAWCKELYPHLWE